MSRVLRGALILAALLLIAGCGDDADHPTAPCAPDTVDVDDDKED